MHGNIAFCAIIELMIRKESYKSPKILAGTYLIDPDCALCKGMHHDVCMRDYRSSKVTHAFMLVS